MSILFEPKAIGKLVLKNRLVRAPTVEKLCTAEGHCAPQPLDLYTRLAEGGVGLIITGGAHVQRNGRGLPNKIGFHQDDVSRAIAPSVIGSTATGLRSSSSWAIADAREPWSWWKTPIAPSPVANLLGVVPVPMTARQISETIANFVRAAERVMEAGFDGVEIHAGHGYLIHEFLSPRTNLRNDEWGGSFENRLRFLTEIYRGMRRQLGGETPILLTLNANDYLEDGIGVGEAVRIAEQMSALGIDAIDVTAGTWETHFFMSRGDIPGNYWLYARAEGEEKERVGGRLTRLAREVRFQEAYLLEYAREIRKKVPCPLILVGGLRTVRVMEEILEEGAADFISLCRPLIRDPEFPNLIRRGLVEKSTCINCNLCLTDKPVACYQMRFRPPHF